jgi:hypothetical protein
MATHHDRRLVRSRDGRRAMSLTTDLHARAPPQHRAGLDSFSHTEYNFVMRIMLDPAGNAVNRVRGVFSLPEKSTHP